MHYLFSPNPQARSFIKDSTHKHTRHRTLKPSAVLRKVQLQNFMRVLEWTGFLAKEDAMNFIHDWTRKVFRNMLSIPKQVPLYVRYGLNEIFLRTQSKTKQQDTKPKNPHENKKIPQTITNTKTQIANATDESTRATFSS